MKKETLSLRREKGLYTSCGATARKGRKMCDRNCDWTKHTLGKCHHQKTHSL